MMQIMQMQCWSRPKGVIYPNMFPMNWGNCTNPNPAAPAWEIIRGTKFNPKGLPFLWNAMDGCLKGVTQAQIIAAVPQVNAQRDYFTKLYKSLLAVNIKPAVIVTDIEGGDIDIDWSIKPEQMQQFARHIAAAERDAMLRPLHEVFADQTLQIAGTGMVPRSAPVVDANGWPYLPCGDDGYSPGGVTSLQLYITSGNYFTLRKFIHDVEWNQGLIQNLNNMGACFGGTLMPWISYASFGGKNVNTRRYIIAEQLKHLRAMGVGTALYWNPKESPADDDAWMAKALADANALQGEPIKSFTPTEMDSDKIVTGPVTSLYTDYLTAKSMDG